MKKNAVFPVSWSSLLVLLLAGCATEVDTSEVDFCNDAAMFQNCSASHDAGDCISAQECKNPVEEDKDYYQADFDGNLKAAENTPYVGYVGRIDRSCRESAGTPKKYSDDIDFLAVHATPGTPLSVYVGAANQSKFRPIAYLYSKEGGGLLFAPRKSGEPYVELQFLAPAEKFYIAIQEYENYGNEEMTECGSTIVGGDDYKYYVRIRKGESSFKSIPLVKGENREESNQFKDPGETHYYSISVPDSASGIRVKVASGDRNPVVSPIPNNRQEGSSGYEWEDNGNGLKSEVPISKARANCADNRCEYRVVVSDYDGKYGYSYKMTISME